MSAERPRKAALAGAKPSRNGHGASVVPEPPDDLERAGREVWRVAWTLPRVEASDASSVERLCRLEDEAARLRALVAAAGEILHEPIVAPKGDVVGERLVTHPAIGALRRIGKEARELCAELGLSPTSRWRLGMPVPADPRHPDAVDVLRAQRAARRRGLGGES